MVPVTHEGSDQGSEASEQGRGGVGQGVFPVARTAGWQLPSDSASWGGTGGSGGGEQGLREFRSQTCLEGRYTCPRPLGSLGLPPSFTFPSHVCSSYTFLWSMNLV